LPTYEYACRDCGQHVEVVQSFRDDPLTTCGTCGGRLRKVYGAAGIIFKGSGYYVNDSRTKPAGDGAKGDGAKKEAPAKEPAAAEKKKAEPSSSSGGESAA
jgi:putative FmdB family regulatory protein